ncbi:DUF4397 domain-containing protein [Agrococcus sp. SGAir0287]|uniref:DUF4397 domain-containing protein n=1 Tax=Agrococcus sp. SGAir0287 TaxID=2070347 RepID=UPI0010CD2DAA|nr:DUF4397 domain-containing protein [Agrococcus sp. SGAir0287]QCR18085.1 hypothetical protein C1N71_00345 [Agrococcus sp. SGAir0287]
MKRKIAIGGAAVLAMSALSAAPALAAEGDATVSVLHAVPDLVVDVYVNGTETVPDFQPGTLTDPLMLAPGAYDIQVYADGAGPAEGGSPAIEANDVQVPANANVTLVAHLDANGNPTLGAFVNDTEPVPAGQARLTVRHLAAAPAVDVRAGGTPVVEDLTNPNEASLVTAAGTVSADVTLAGTEDVVIGPADLTLAEGTNTIVVAWGSAEADNLALAVQTVEAHSAPTGVPSGLGGASDDAAAPAIVLALAGMLGLAAAVLWRRSRLVEARER